MRALILTLVILALTAARAQADTYCVDSTSGCDHTVGSLAAAFTAADATSTDDTIQVGPGSYAGPFTATAGGGALTVNGAGTDQTTLTVAADAQTVLSFAVAGSGVSHLHVQLPASTGDTGIALDGSAGDVLIDDPNGSTGAVGVEMDHPDSLSKVTVHLGNGASSLALRRTANGTGAEDVADSTLAATDGVYATSGDWDLERDRIAAYAHGVQALDGSSQHAAVSIAESLIQVTATDPSTCGPVQCFALGVSGSSLLSAQNDTVVGTGGPFPGAWVLGGTSGKLAQLGLDSTVITGFTPSLQCDERNGGGALLRSSYSAWDTAVATGGCAVPDAPHLGDPQLTTTFSPKWSSPLIDAGYPQQIHALDAKDLLGNPRYVGNVDIGALEYQRQAPSVTAASVTAGFTGADVPFAVAKASDPDPGDTLTFTWAFDDGGGASGAQVTHEFATPGVHSATVTATDPTGLTGTGTVLVPIIARHALAAPPPSPPPPPPDTTAPRITKLKLKKTRLSFTLSEAAKVKVTFEQRVGKHYKRLSGTLTRSETNGTHALHVKKRRRGRYRLTVTATDAAGNRSKAARLSFSG
jgi:hypothetical protein